MRELRARGMMSADLAGRALEVSLALLLVVLILPLGVSGGGCTPEEGVLLAVSGDDVATLEFFVATQKKGDVYVLDKGIQGGGISGLRADVRGRRLRAHPYKLFIEAPPTGPSPILRALVLGKRVENGRETLYSFGVTDPPQPFVDGEVLRRSVALERLQASRRRVSVRGRCYHVQRLVDQHWRYDDLLPDDDRDCDGSATPKDCDDNDGEVHPGALELCDGKDNDCDGQKAPAKVACYALQGDDCFAGMRGCHEVSGGGLDGVCETAGDPVARAYCDAYDGCKARDPQACAAQVLPRRYACTLQRKRDTGKSCGVGRVDLSSPTSTEHCRWKLVNDGGLQAKLINAGSCADAKLEVDLGGSAEGTVVVEFIAGRGDNMRTGWVREYHVIPRDVDTCEDAAHQRLECKSR